MAGDHRIEKLAFSPHEDELLALLRTPEQRSSYKAIVYSTTDFSPDSRLRDDSPKSITGNEVAEWTGAVGNVLDVVFSSDGRKAAFCTSHDSRCRSRIGLLMKGSRGWKDRGEKLVQVIQKNDASPGMNNIGLYRH